MTTLTFAFLILVTYSVIFPDNGTMGSYNVARGKAAVSSSVLNGYSKTWTAGKAVDGISDQNVLDNSCLHTQESTERNTEFLTVNLKGVFSISRIEIYFVDSVVVKYRSIGYSLMISSTNSTGGPYCYQDHTQNSTNFLLHQNQSCEGTGQFVSIVQSQISKEIPPPKVPKRVGPILEVCEFEIYGCEKGKYGPQCEYFCPIHCNNSICDPDNGTCWNGCNDGFYGPLCTMRQLVTKDSIATSGSFLYKRWNASNTIDGCTNTNVYCDSCLHTDQTRNITPEYLTIDLRTIHTISRVEIYFVRYNGDKDKCMPQTNISLEVKKRSVGYHISISNKTLIGKSCYTDNTSVPSLFNLDQNVSCMGIGQLINITQRKKSDTNGITGPILEICEVKVYGCLPWFHGEYCEFFMCPVHCSKSQCHKENGTCSNGCEDGWQGSHCSECQDKKYGEFCDNVCGHCENQAKCDTETGHCPNGKCEPGYRDALCKEKCQDGRYGKACLSECGYCTKNGYCDHINGSCPNGLCKAGYTGLLCKQECRNGTYGFNCSNLCGNCKNNYCNKQNGNCPHGGCGRGFNGTKCNTSCPNGTFGYNCEEACGHCKDGKACDKRNGTCPESLCDRGFYGPLCNATCIDGRYGFNCNESCGHCRDTTSCDKMNGSCPKGCAKGFNGSICIEDCSNGTYGYNCEKTCGACRYGVACAKTNGKCQLCERGFNGSLCNEECVDGTFGYNCNETCGHCRNDITCDKKFGNCSDGLCKKGFNGSLCRQECPNGTFGYKCAETCGKCRNNNICDKEKGTCPDELCDRGYNGSKCKEECTEGGYGYNCNETCGYCKNFKACNRKTGQCENYGCDRGYKGLLCTEMCQNGTYGFNCANKCFNCIDESCDMYNGSCLTDCKPGFKGPLCDIALDPPLKQIMHNDNSPIIGGGVAGVLIVALVIVIIILIWRRKVSNTKTTKEEQEFSDLSTSHGQSVEKESKTSVGPYYSIKLKDTYIDLKDDPPKTSDDSSVDQQYENVRPNTRPNKTYEIPCKTLADKVKEKEDNKNKSFKEEFEALPKGLLKPCEAAQMTPNRSKNRFKTTFPYDDTRIILKTFDDNESDYVNANYIQDTKGRGTYIASQGPRTHTVIDMWRLIWQEKVSSIVMLTNLQEKRVDKCAQYWPDLSCTEKYGNLSIKTNREKVYSNYTIRIFNVHNTKENKSREITHYHYTTWPDHGVPESLDLVMFHNKVQREALSSRKVGPPLLVHCSAGIGRTGTFIALDALLNHVEDNDSVNIFHFIKHMREEERMNMIQTVDQYIAIHHLLLEAIRTKYYPISRSSFAEEVKRMCSTAAPANQNALRLQIAELNDLKPNYSDDDFTRGLHNQDCNIDPNILPVDRYMLYLTSHVRGRNDYINAVTVPTQTALHSIVVTNVPKKNTTVDLIRLLLDHGSFVVDLSGSSHDKQKWYPDPSSTKDYDPFEVERSELKTSNTANVTESDISVFQKKNATPHSFRLFETKIWPSNASDDDGLKALCGLVRRVLVWNGSSADGKIVIVSKDGVSRCDVFCAVYNALQQFELDEEIDMFNIVRQLQIRRPQFIPTVEEYKLCFDVVSYDLESNNESIYANV